MGDVVIGGEKPAIHLPREIVKGKKHARVVPLTWDRGVLIDIAAHKQWRRIQGAMDGDYFVLGRKMHVNLAYFRWKRIIKNALGSERCRQLKGLHVGRHTFASFAAWSGRRPQEVRDALGHRDIGITNDYLHILEDEDSHAAQMFSPSPPGAIRIVGTHRCDGMIDLDVRRR